MTVTTMPTKRKPRTETFIKLHKDGSVWARGQTQGGVATGYWEWFRRDGTRLRSGYFERGEQTGEWTTYDSASEIYKVTSMHKAKQSR
jgi:hypothetical protein